MKRLTHFRTAKITSRPRSKSCQDFLNPPTSGNSTARSGILRLSIRYQQTCWLSFTEHARSDWLITLQCKDGMVQLGPVVTIPLPLAPAPSVPSSSVDALTLW